MTRIQSIDKLHLCKTICFEEVCDNAKNTTCFHSNNSIIFTTQFHATYGSIMPGHYFSSGTVYAWGFNGKEKDDEISGTVNKVDFGARIYDSRLGRWLSLDPLQSDYSFLSPYNFSENNPIFFNDPDGQNAKATITTDAKGNKTITITSTVYINGSIKKSAEQIQKGINKYWNKQFKSKEINGVKYNVKFDITVKEISTISPDEVFRLMRGDGGNPDVNYVTMVDPKSNESKDRVMADGHYRSYVSGAYGKWDNNASYETYAHEMGHFLGLKDLYYKWEGINGPFFGKEGESSYLPSKLDERKVDPIKKNDLMGEGPYQPDCKVSDRDINDFASYIVSNIKGGSTIYLKSSSFGGPTVNEESKASIGTPGITISTDVHNISK